MKNIKIVGLIALLLWMPSCKDFDELQVNPNRTTQTHPSLLLTGIEISSFRTIDLSAALASRMMVYTDGAANEQYYGWQRAGFDRYSTMRQIVKMEEEAKREGIENYLALALFFKSYNILEISKVFGDIPYTEALKATSKLYTPKYDTQEEIYVQVLNDLQTASNALDASKGKITGDIIYGGDLVKWKKLINSFALRVLISLSKKPGNTNLNVVNRFKEIVNNPAQYPIFTSNADNAALPFADLEGNRYPYFNSNGLKTAYYLEESFVNRLKDLQDPRLFTFADRKPQGSALPDTDFDAYGGLGGSAPLADNTQRLLNGEASAIDKRYYDDPVNEPSMALSYAEVEFTLAEAAALGWITDDPELHYNKGIKASMSFYKISSAAQDAYLLRTGVDYIPANGIEMIITQKYINYFMNGGWEAFYNNRRTGFPVFDVSGGGILNNGEVPKRWMYPQSELQLNTQNVQSAISRQYPGGDNINGEMWLLKTE
ncbi:MAG: SusD/RagB family nutrient-binding outer membrane lipoprotein [Bacteroidota bacterium]